MAGCGCCEGANRIVTILEVGRNCSAPILKVGVNWREAISKEKVSCTAVCMPPPTGCGCCDWGAGAGCIAWLGCGAAPVGAFGAVRMTGAGIGWVGCIDSGVGDSWTGDSSE